LLPLWLSGGKARLKQKLACSATFDPKNLPYNDELIGWFKRQYAKGRKLVLCTASDRSFASQIALHLKIFEGVIASDGVTNVSGKKAELL
jgi:hydroxymethylpyrimidine pyrophosphatase-like HAD family hydrolase